MSRSSDLPGVDDYLTRLAGQDEALARVARETAQRQNATMQTGADQGALLTLLARLVGAREAVEVGTFTGYGAICIARGLAAGGRLTCLEVDPHYAEVARRNLEAAGVGDRVSVELGPAQAALDRMPLEPRIDFAYVDADKAAYPGYYEALVPRLRPGGLLVLDNMLLGGRVVDPQDERSRIIVALNDRIAADERVNAALIGLADGVMLARRVP